jgi:hypothetical protein
LLLGCWLVAGLLAASSVMHLPLGFLMGTRVG